MTGEPDARRAVKYDRVVLGARAAGENEAAWVGLTGERGYVPHEGSTIDRFVA